MIRAAVFVMMACALASLLMVALSRFGLAADARAALETFFHDPACSAPCLVGIMPGVSRFSDVVAVLEADPTISNLWLLPGMEIDSGDLFWTWATAPRFINAAYEGRMWFQNGIVQSVSVRTWITYGEAILTLGGQNAAHPWLLRGNPPNISQTAGFSDQRLMLYTRTGCPLTPASFWHGRVWVFLRLEPMRDQPADRSLDWRTC